MKMIEILKELMEELRQKGQIPTNQTLIEENLLVTDLLLSELFDPVNAYEYLEYSGIYYYTDSGGIRFCVRLAYTPVKEPYWELKSWWVDPKTKKAVYSYLPDDTTSVDLIRRSDTTAAIFKEKLVPFFQKQTYSNVMKIFPMDSRRFNYSLRLVKKFAPKEWEIIENFPKSIVVKKPE